MKLKRGPVSDSALGCMASLYKKEIINSSLQQILALGCKHGISGTKPLTLEPVPHLLRTSNLELASYKLHGGRDKAYTMFQYFPATRPLHDPSLARSKLHTFTFFSIKMVPEVKLSTQTGLHASQLLAAQKI